MLPTVSQFVLFNVPDTQSALSTDPIELVAAASACEEFLASRETQQQRSNAQSGIKEISTTSQTLSQP